MTPPDGSANDTRFQFEVIRQLAESVRVNGEVMRDMQQTQISMLERLARIEEHKFHEAVGLLNSRVDLLEKTRDEQRGALGVRAAIMQVWPAIALLLIVIWNAGQALGFFHLPERPSLDRRPTHAVH